MSHLRWKTSLIKTTKWSKVTQPGSTELLLHYYYLHYYTYYFDLKYNISSMHASSFSPGEYCLVFIKCSVNKSLPAMWETHIWSRFDPWVRKIPWRRKWQPTPVLLPGKFHGWRSLVGYSLWGRKESDTTERLHFSSLHFKHIRERKKEQVKTPIHYQQFWFSKSKLWIGITLQINHQFSRTTILKKVK